MSEFPGKGPVTTAAWCYKETVWALLGLHTHAHTHAHPGTSHIHTHECHTHVTRTQVSITHKHVTHTYVTQTHACHRDTHVHTHVPQHVSTSTMIHTPFSSCLSGPFAHIGMLTSVNDGSTAINQVSQEALSEKFTILPVGKCAR